MLFYKKIIITLNSSDNIKIVSLSRFQQNEYHIETFL